MSEKKNNKQNKQTKPNEEPNLPKEKVLKPPKFTKVNELKPGTEGLNLVLKVIDVSVLVTKTLNNGKTMKVAECTVGDDTGTILFSARNEQLDIAKKGESIVLRNSKIILVNKTMRLSVDQWGEVQPFSKAKELVSVKLDDSFKVNTSNNLSLQKYEVVIQYE